MDEINNLINLLDKTFNAGAWHGPAVREVLSKVSASECKARIPGTHSILELVQHMTSWRNYVIKKLQGDTAFKITDETNFPQDIEWNLALENLEKSQLELSQAIRSLSPSKLPEKVPNTSHDYTYYTLVHGIIHHDLYHIGQIILIHKSINGVSSDAMN